MGGEEPGHAAYDGDADADEEAAEELERCAGEVWGVSVDGESEVEEVLIVRSLLKRNRCRCPSALLSISVNLQIVPWVVLTSLPRQI